jgi:hypothetical protein
MERFYRKFQAREHPAIFNGLVLLGIRLHFLSRVLRDRLHRLFSAKRTHGKASK